MRVCETVRSVSITDQTFRTQSGFVSCFKSDHLARHPAVTCHFLDCSPHLISVTQISGSFRKYRWLNQPDTNTRRASILTNISLLFAARVVTSCSPSRRFINSRSRPARPKFSLDVCLTLANILRITGDIFHFNKRRVGAII